MVDISGLSEREKSLMLARAMGWGHSWKDVNGEERFVIFDPLYRRGMGDYPVSYRVMIPGQGFVSMVSDNLYDLGNMGLAWRVLNWANENMPFDSSTPSYSDGMWQEWELWWDGLDIKGEHPADAQAIWLDRILELAIEAGIVEVK